MEDKKVMTHITKGLVIALAIIVINLVGYFTALAYENWFSWLGNAILIGGIIWGCVQYSNQKNNMVTFGNVFGHGFKISVVVALIVIVYTAIAVTLIFPEMKDKAIDIAREKMEEKNNLSSSQIEQGIEMTRKFFLAFVVGAILIGYLFFGAIAALIGAAIAKKRPVNPLEQLDQMQK